jgi:hypothetical protein
MKNTRLLKKIAKLESVQDHLQTELSYLDRLLKNVGFEGGIATMKAVAEEIILQAKKEQSGLQA